MREEDIPRHVLDALLNAYARTEFKETFSKCLRYQAESKPNNIALPDNICIPDRLYQQFHPVILRPRMNQSRKGEIGSRLVSGSVKAI